MNHRVTSAIAVILSGSALNGIASAAQTPMSREAQNGLVNDYCSGCHSAKTKKGDLILEGFDAASPFLGPDVLEKMILKVRVGMMPPSSSSRPDDQALNAFVETLEARADESAARRADPGWRPFQRLNRAEYERAVRDLVGVKIDASGFLPADTVSAGFDNIADVQTVSPALIASYLRGAAQVSRLAMGEGARDTRSRRRLLSCAPASTSAESTCASTIVKRLIGLAYRGTADADDLAAAMAFYTRGRDGADFDNGIRLALQSILANPKFLFRLEPPVESAQSREVSATALASRLSFFLWSSSPDASLLDAAAKGELRTEAGLLMQVRRMLADPRSDALTMRFATQWLRLQDLGKTMPDAKLFPRFDKALADDMRRETELFVSNLFRTDGSVLNLITSDQSFINERLAAHYGIPGIKGNRFRQTRVPDERRGLLGQGSVLVLTSLGERTSPVLRGKWVLDVLLGTPPPPPPPNVPALDDTVKPTRNGTALSTRQRVEEHRKNPACSGCHRTIDPPGLTLEGFDATGAKRSSDNGVAVDVAAELYDGRNISGPARLRDALLVHQDQVLRNFAAQLLTYATNRRLGPRDMPLVRSIVKRAVKSNNRFSAFVTGIVLSDAFRMSNPPKES